MESYNGHRSWAAWNVSLWLNNDEGLYRDMRYCIKVSVSRKRAAGLMLHMLKEVGQQCTPDGARYTVTSIMEAMRGL